eukprot:3417573-Rhodomonas_salina.1
MDPLVMRWARSSEERHPSPRRVHAVLPGAYSSGAACAVLSTPVVIGIRCGVDRVLEAKPWKG